jgi:Cys-rich protein (TIGR01571 family)
MDRYPQPSPIPSLPASPGQLPVKHDPAAEAQERREKDLSIVPDDNPLATPTFTSSFGAKSPTRAPGTLNSVNVTGNHMPGQVLHPNQELRGGTWTNGLCDCTDPATCCLGLWCPCILYGRTQYRLSRKSERKDPTNLLGYETCNASCTLMALLCGCQCSFTSAPSFPYK